MARDTKRALREALAPKLTQVEEAFLEAFLDIRSVAAQRTIDDIIQRYMQTGNLEAALQDIRAAISFASRGFYAPLDNAIQQAFITGGAYQAGLVPKRSALSAPRLVVRFDGRHPRAETWTRERTATLITEIADDTDLLIRQTLLAGLETNRPYKSLTLDLIGRTEGNRRKGGLIGLHSRQADAVRAARAELEAGDFTAYLSRSDKMRDGRFDRMIRKARDEGGTLSGASIDRITGRYADNLLKQRGRTIARTEANGAMNAGRFESIQQMIDDGKISADLVTLTWVATVGKFTRDHHLALNGTKIKWGEYFISPKTGAAMRRPHDQDAPAVDIVNCRCNLQIEIDYLAMAA